MDSASLRKSTVSPKQHFRKFITWEDVAVSCQHWSNRSNAPIVLRLYLPDELGFQNRTFTWEAPRHAFTLAGVLEANGAFEDSDRFILAPGESVRFVLAAAVDEISHAGHEQLRLRARKWLNCGNPLDAQESEYAAFFDDVPVFECSDPLYTTAYWYRWYILRNAYAQPQTGSFRHGAFYEGRSHKMVKDVLNPYGHEFSQLIPLSTPMHVTDARWKADGEWCRESLLSLVDSMDLDGVFRTMKTDQFGFPYGHYCEWALWGYWLVHRDNAFIRDVLPAFQKNVQGTWALFSDGQDDLQIAYNHRRTGKEYQPSYWYFRGYPDNAGDEDSYDWLKRVDLSVYLYQNARGIERLCAALDDPPKKEFADLADRLEQQVLFEMWDEGTGFFYDLHHKTGQKAMVKNVVGIYPLWAQITDQRHLRVIDAMLDSRQFSTGSGLASVSRQCPAYRPQGSWKGHFLKGRDGCMWAGPSWPYTTAIALEAIALQSRRFGHRYDEGFTRLLREYSW